MQESIDRMNCKRKEYFTFEEHRKERSGDAMGKSKEKTRFQNKKP